MKSPDEYFTQNPASTFPSNKMFVYFWMLRLCNFEMFGQVLAGHGVCQDQLTEICDCINVKCIGNQEDLFLSN